MAHKRLNGWLKMGVLITCGLLFWFLMGKYRLSLQDLKQQKVDLVLYYQKFPLKTLCLYFISYVTFAALSIPGATLLTVAGGAIFGFWTALPLISLASTVGACLAFLLARFIIRNWVNERFKDKVDIFNNRFKKEGGLYLFALRLSPAFPFFVVNLVMGLTPIPLKTFFWVSQIGMLPGSVIYINAGTQLSKLQSLKGILSPSIFVSLTLLGVLPLGIKLIKKEMQKHTKSRKNE